MDSEIADVSPRAPEIAAGARALADLHGIGTGAPDGDVPEEYRQAASAVLAAALPIVLRRLQMGAD